MIPLYQEARKIDFTSHGFGSANRGLIYNKWIDVWDNTKDGKASKNKEKRENVLKKFAGDSGSEAINSLLQAHLERRHRLFYKQKSVVLQARTQARLISGLGSAHFLETGFVWHPSLGVPYIPASSIKGAIRAYLTNWHGERPEEAATADRLFGDTEENGMGCLVVFDALPCRSPKLNLDIMNPHYSPYYKSPEDDPPADYYSPIPIQFLAVAADHLFEFSLALNPNQGREKDLELGSALLQDTLATIGCGAKTAVGYGVFYDFRDISAGIVEKFRAEEEEAMLAGLTPLERSMLALRQGVEKGQPKDKLKDLSMKLYEAMKDQTDADKSQVAQTLKMVWLYTGDWEGKLSKKQGPKVTEVKSILGE